jgi:GNAT superfamily N-acetyltransferase
MTVTIRRVREVDADGIAVAHVRAWQAAYVGMLPEDYLDALSVPDRAEYWRRALAGTPRPQSATLVAVDHDETVVGFASVGAAALDVSDARGELYALNVDPSAWGTGAGVALLEAVTQVLTDVGFVEAGRYCAEYEDFDAFDTWEQFFAEHPLR